MKNLYKSNIKAFTLAETLITLVIIGIIAAITIPAIITNLNQHHFKSALKKNLSVFQNAFNLIYGYNYDEFRDWNYVNGKLSFTTDVAEKLFKYLSVQQVCGHKSGYFTDTIYAKNKSEAKWYNLGIGGVDSESYTFILADGTTVVLSVFANESMKYLGITKNLINTEANLGITIDVNGLKKPNTLGYDIFAFVLTDKGIVPAGIDNNSIYCDNLNVNYNWDCAYKVLNNK